MQLTLNNLSVSIEDKPILKDITHSFASGAITAILGPNGSGKSTLGNSILGAPFIEITSGDIFLNETSLQELSSEKRAQLGLFLSFQNPLPLPGVSAYDLFRASLTSDTRSPLELKQEVQRLAGELGIDEAFLKRPLYEGFSGGERKKMEALQAVLYAPEVAIFDEIDTGVDVDALKTIVTFLQKHLSGKTLIFITHSHKLLSLIEPEEVLVLKNGELAEKGGSDLAHHIMEHGFGGEEKM